MAENINHILVAGIEPIDPVAILDAQDNPNGGGSVKRAALVALAGVPLVASAATIANPETAGATSAVSVSEQGVESVAQSASTQAEDHFSRSMEPVSANRPAGSPGHTVVEGDTFWDLGGGTPEGEQAWLNANPGVDPENLQIGQRLNAPGGGSSAGGESRTVAEGDTLGEIASDWGTTPQAIQAANPTVVENIDRIFPGEELHRPGTANIPGPQRPSANLSTPPAPAGRQGAFQVPVEASDLGRNRQIAQNIAAQTPERDTAADWQDNVQMLPPGVVRITGVSQEVANHALQHDRDARPQPPRPPINRAVDNLVPQWAQEEGINEQGKAALANALADEGLPLPAIAGIMGNVRGESDGYNSDINEYGNGIGYGFAQWSFERRDALEEAARREGVPVSDPAFQARFMVNEMKNRAPRDNPNSGRTEWDEITQIASPEEAADYFRWNFERPNELVSGAENRRTEARAVYDQLNGEVQRIQREDEQRAAELREIARQQEAERRAAQEEAAQRESEQPEQESRDEEGADNGEGEGRENRENAEESRGNDRENGGEENSGESVIGDILGDDTEDQEQAPEEEGDEERTSEENGEDQEESGSGSEDRGNREETSDEESDQPEETTTTTEQQGPTQAQIDQWNQAVARNERNAERWYAAAAENERIANETWRTMQGDRQMSEDGAGNPIEIVRITGDYVNADIADNVARMFWDARQAGINFELNSPVKGHRSPEDQHNLRVENGCPDDTSPSSTCDVPTAPVGASNHQSGHALDLTFNGGQRIAGTHAFEWLQQNAANYGLHNFEPEPWHWSTDGS